MSPVTCAERGRKQASCIAGRFDPRGDVGGISQRPNLIARSQRQAARIDCDAHRPVERADQHGESAGPCTRTASNLLA